ncbi:MAG: histone deacetylase [Okeania sp. SIO3I5]|uniref:histone deacetylase family protein n=1 Tax=Okeania sp. SIO3I5 TaxID=2607805 RepID=UPI0013B86865|nr:histone deacetylase [Okeania sp. SIO3I5]NEQ35923.1 histone deacetylase [Okeania sp. SIO3I5]
MVSVIYSDEFLEHKTGIRHPERPERLTAIVETLKAFPFENGQLQWESPTPVEQRNPSLKKLLRKVHSRTQIGLVAGIAKQGGGYLDGDTPVSAKSYDVALLAVSAWLDGVDLVLANGKPAFVLARPPGHHAESERSMGFCLFSNAAIAAHYALEKPDINKVAILDWDVHHGNGTQEIVETNENIVYCSLHQSPCYPGTGSANERGAYNNVLNIPMSPGSTMAIYQPIFEEKVIPFLANFQPDLLIVSAGYDANHDDPLAGISLQPKDYGLFTKYCLQITRKILFGLEGGYDLPSLSQSVLATIEACL